MRPILARQLHVGDLLDGADELKSVSYYLDPDSPAPAQIVAVDTAGDEYVFDPTDTVWITRPARDDQPN